MPREAVRIVKLYSSTGELLHETRIPYEAFTERLVLQWRGRYFIRSSQSTGSFDEARLLEVPSS